MRVMAVDQWMLSLFRAVDAMDASTFAKAFADDGIFQFGNSDPAVGRDRIEQNVSGFFSMIGGLSHEITGVWSGSWEGGDVRSVETKVTYTRQDGTRTEPLPATSTLRMEGDRIKDYRIFMDVTPLFAPVDLRPAPNRPSGAPSLGPRLDADWPRALRRQYRPH